MTRKGTVFLGAIAAVVACSRGVEREDRAVVVYSPRDCPASGDDAYSVLYAGG